MPIKKVLKGKVKYKFEPKVHVIAQQESRVQELHLSRKIVKSVLKGEDYEVIAERHNLTPEEARRISKVAIQRFAGDLGHTATEAREIDLKRMDALLLQLHDLIWPQPTIDNATGLPIIPRPDMVAIKLYLDILGQRSKLLGTEAAHKLEEEKLEVLRREYIGIESNKNGEIDL